MVGGSLEFPTLLLLGVDTGILDSSTIGRDPTGSSKSSSSAAVIPPLAPPKKKVASVEGEVLDLEVDEVNGALEVVFWILLGLVLLLKLNRSVSGSTLPMRLISVWKPCL